jgi:hypothetical protein
MMLNAPASFKKAPDTESTSAPAAPVTKPVGLARHVADRHRRAALDERIAELYATPAAVRLLMVAYSLASGRGKEKITCR